MGSKDRDRDTSKSKSKENWQKTLDEIIALHRRGVDGDRVAVKSALSLVEKLKSQTDNNLVKAYYGSILTLVGRDSYDPTDRVQKALTGLKHLTEAVKKEPDNIDIRLLRGFVCNRLPKIYFQKTAIAIEDFNHAIALHERKSLLSNESYWLVLYELGEAYKKSNKQAEANATWTKLQSLTDRYQSKLSKQGFN